MTKKGSRGKQNLRQRKKQSNNRQDEDDDALLEATAPRSSSKSKSNIVPVLLAGFFIALVVGLATTSISSPDPEEASSKRTDPSKSKGDPTSNRRLDEDTDTDAPPIAHYVTEYNVLRTLPHDTKAFTQGLTFRPDNSSILYEATGMYNASEVKILDLSNGDVLQSYQTPGQYFGEGLSYFKDESNASDVLGRMIHVTWKEQTGFIFDMDTLEVLEEFSYTTTLNEGWGIIHVPGDNEFIVSDGSPYLHFWNMKYQEIREKVEVTYQTDDMAKQGIPRQPLKLLNELEWDESTRTVLANVWFQNIIVRIDPRTGYVLTIYDLRSLYTDRLPGSDVFNGIALSSEGDLWVTGKYWPHLYQISLGDT